MTDIHTIAHDHNIKVRHSLTDTGYHHFEFGSLDRPYAYDEMWSSDIPDPDIFADRCREIRRRMNRAQREGVRRANRPKWRMTLWAIRDRFISLRHFLPHE